MKKWICLSLASVLALVAIVLFRAGLAGESTLEAMIGDQLKSIVNARGRFDLAFDSIDYQAPDRVVMAGLKLSLADPDVPAPLVEIDQGTVVLANIPRRGEPIRIRSITLAKPTVRIESFLAAAQRKSSATRPTTRPELSSILTLERIDIRDGTLSYDNGKGSPMQWSQLNADLTLETVDAQWHRVKLSVDQSPLISVALAGEIHLDRLIARNIALDASLDLNDPAGVKFFTPQLQTLINRYEVRGRAKVQARGIVDAQERDATRLDATAALLQGNLTIGAYHIPLDALTLAATLRGNALRVEPINAKALGGDVRGRMEMTLVDAKPIIGTFELKDLRLEQLERARDTADPTSLTGRLNGLVVIDTTLPDLRAVIRDQTDGQRWGTGSLNVKEGRLMRVPVLGELLAVTRKVSGLLTGKGVNQDQFDAQFELIDRTFNVPEMSYRGDAVGMRGKGRVGFKGEVDLLINAGPLERIQQQLGPIGRWWGKLTDSIMTYTVKGTLKKPIVKPVLGGG